MIRFIGNDRYYWPMAHQPIMSPERERQLVRQAKGGDAGALGELLNAYQRRIFHVSLRMVGNRDDAAELAQEGMLRAIRHIDTFEADSRFSTWLIRIVMNLSISHLRKRRVRQSASLEAGRGGGDGDEAGLTLRGSLADRREPDPGTSVETKDQVDRLLEALEGLDPSLRSVIVLRDLQEMDYRQIADVLGVPIGTVKSRLFRARLALRQAMESAAGRKTEVADG